MACTLFIRNKREEPRGLRLPFGSGKDIKIYYDTLCRINSIPITVYHSPTQKLNAVRLERGEEYSCHNFIPGYSYISSAHLSCRRLIRTHISAFEVIKKKIFILGFSLPY